MNKEIKKFFDEQKDNVRKDSMRYVYDYIIENNVQNFVEFGMSRLSGIEGDFTILGALISKLQGVNFTSVDNEKATVDEMMNYFQNSSSEIFNLEQGSVQLICDDQYQFMKNYSGDKFQYVFLDGGDGNKHGALQCLLDSNMLDSKALICVDDMVAKNWWGDESYYLQAKEVVRIVNEDSRLTPVDLVEYSPPNEEQKKWRDYNSQYPIPDNDKVYPNGVRQFDYQILLEYKE